jgi:YggT family protein
MAYRIVSLLFFVIEMAILIRVFLSWLPVPKEHKLIDLLYQVTEPILAPIRNLLQRSSFGRNMMFDFSPIIAFLLIGLVRNIVLSLLH